MDRSALEDPTTVHLVRSDDRTALHRPAVCGIARHSLRFTPARDVPPVAHRYYPDRAHQRTIDCVPSPAPIDLERAQ